MASPNLDYALSATAVYTASGHCETGTEYPLCWKIERRGRKGSGLVHFPCISRLPVSCSPLTSP